jgi:disulfide oxidoreductase YuzD
MEYGAANTRTEEDKLARRSSRYRFLQKHKNKKANKKAVALQNKILKYENIFYSIKVTDDEVREHRLSKKIYYLGIFASEENAPGYSGGTTATP